MGLSAQTVWEVRATGNDNNGAGWKAGAAGTDYSQQDAAQKTGTDLAIHASDNTKVRPVAAGVAAADVGNLIKIRAGSGFTVGYYEITAQDGTYWTLDRAAGTVGSTGGTYNMGGAAATLTVLTTVVPAGNIIWAKAGSYAANASTGTWSGGGAPSPTTPPTRLYGYSFTRGDGQRAVFSVTNGGQGFRTSGSGWIVANIEVSNGGGSGMGQAFLFQSTQNTMINCKATGFTQLGANADNGPLAVIGCEFTGGTAAASGCVSMPGSNAIVAGCKIHANACPGLVGSGASASATNWALYNLIFNNTGVTSDGIRDIGNCFGNTVYGSGRHGLNMTGTVIVKFWRNNILAGNAGYGAVAANAAGYPPLPIYDGNAYWNNTSGTRSNMDDAGAINADNAFNFYANPLDKILTADPFTNKATGDFTLNTTAGGGASCRGYGWPGEIPGVAQLGYMDLGALQTKPSNPPSDDDVRFGVQYGFQGTEFTGTLTLPAESEVELGVSYGADGAEFTGTIPTPSYPSEDDVRDGTTYGTGPIFTGNLELPVIGDVLAGVGYGTNGTEFTGSLALPSEDDVRLGTVFGSFTGNLELPITGDVRFGTQYGANGTEFTGTLIPLSPPVGGGGIDLSKDWMLDPNPVTINYMKKLTESTWDTPQEIGFVSQNMTLASDVARNPALLQNDSTVFHIWRDQMGLTLEPKLGDRITVSGKTYTVDNVEKLDLDSNGVQRYRLSCLRKL